MEELKYIINIGDIVKYKKKTYIVVNVFYDLGGCSKVVQLIRICGSGENSTLFACGVKFVKEFRDDDINKLNLINKRQ